MHHAWELLKACLTISCAFGLLWGASHVQAQTPAESPDTAAHNEKQTIMLGLLGSIEQVEQEIKATQRELRSPQGEGRKDELTAQIGQLGNKLATLRKNLQEVAAGVELNVFTKQQASEVDWKERFIDLLRPVLSELTRLTTRPREIEELRSTILEHQIRQALDDGGYTPMLENLRVEFAQAGASSLDQKVLADFSGEAAPKYHILSRAIQRICVDTCNAHGWVIPFTQLTLHVADSANHTALPLQQPSFGERTGGAMDTVPE